MVREPGVCETTHGKIPPHGTVNCFLRDSEIVPDRMNVRCLGCAPGVPWGHIPADAPHTRGDTHDDNHDMMVNIGALHI